MGFFENFYRKIISKSRKFYCFIYLCLIYFNTFFFFLNITFIKLNHFKPTEIVVIAKIAEITLKALFRSGLGRKCKNKNVLEFDLKRMVGFFLENIFKTNILLKVTITSPKQFRVSDL